jgi:hypothetical protein
LRSLLIFILRNYIVITPKSPGKFIVKFLIKQILYDSKTNGGVVSGQSGEQGGLFVPSGGFSFSFFTPLLARFTNGVRLLKTFSV